ncbi:MAG TPA: class I SAM-dependent methyltransferase [Candidatus Paceibacterota bacterium]|jgi:ubiquinone/menaquinone biosynthesis C-methylase UbiE|nr:class I SAM-dependent methyltransferase [Candidatus Paceibacterota bacterium]
MFTDPVKNLKAFGLREDNIVADLGAGTGYYTLPAGAIVSKGKVYAVEITKDFLTTIKNKVEEAHLNNVEILWGNVEVIGGTRIGDGILDAVIASNILFQVEDKSNFIEEIRRILKPHGKVLVIDWTVDSEGDSAAISLKGALPKERAFEMFEKKGFALDRDIDAGAHHYGMILVKTNE